VNAFAAYFHAFRTVHVCAILCALTNCLLAADPVVSNISASSGTWTATGSMSIARYGHTATLLSSGKVLVVGGQSGTYQYTASAEIYDPETQLWTVTGAMSTARAYHKAILLKNGMVLIVGGAQGVGEILSSAELYDPTTGTWSVTGSTSEPRSGHSLTILGNGKALVAGGVSNSSELYDPETGIWSRTGNLNGIRWEFPTVLLPNGRVLASGGQSDYNNRLATSEIYNPDTGLWSVANVMNFTHHNHGSVLLENGKILVTMGEVNASNAELYDYTNGTWTATGTPTFARSGSTIVKLRSGSVLVSGGQNPATAFLSSGELYSPSSGSWSTTGPMTTPRHGHTVTLMNNGVVLVAGGLQSSQIFLSSSELFSNLPIINQQPQNLTLNQWRRAVFKISAEGEELQFQWQKNGFNIEGATSDVLTLNNVQLTDAANYAAIVTNREGSLTSLSATLVVRPDADGDGLTDAEETDVYHTRPDLADSDGDSLSDFVETQTFLTNPLLADTDGDSLNDGDENTLGTNLLAADTDGDGINDGAEVQQGRSPSIAEPVVTNLVAAQRTGTKLFDISYDLASTTPAVKMSLEISSDGGLTYNVPVTSTTGAIGNGVTVGSGKTIVWNAGVDWNGNFSNRIRFRLVADDLQVSGFSLIPAGAFTMGRTSGDTDADSPPVNVNVSQFYMSKHEVTKAEWDEVRTWAVNNGYTDLEAGDGKANNHPVHSISWYAMVKWCNAKSQKEGLIPCYSISGAVMKTGTVEPTANWVANGYRLPTEAEWEKAARGGVSNKRFPWGSDIISHNEANFNNNGFETYKSGTIGDHPTYFTGTLPATAPVGSFAANGYSLHDMAGNVFEWCWDWHDESTYVNNATDPRGPESGSYKISRGGSWGNYAVKCRASDRDYSTPSVSNYSVGFRVARSMTAEGANSAAVSSQDIVVDVRDFTLSITPMTNGAVVGAGSYLSGISLNLTATPEPGYLLGAWTGEASGSANPTTVLMDADKTVGATFVQDTRDPDNDGLTNYQEIITHSTDPNLADSDGDSINDGAEVAQGRIPKTAEPVVTNLIGTQRQGTKLVDISYDLTSVTPTVKVTLEVSQDGGLTYNVPATSITGAIGNAVTVGSGKTIVWNAGADWDSNFSNQMRFRLLTDNSASSFSLIPAGTFTMGRTSGDAAPNASPVNVTVSQFYMGKYEVTKSEWDEVRTWAVNNGYTDLGAGAGKASNHPVQTVSWWDVIKWCNAKSQKEGLTPCYTVSGSVMKTGTTAPEMNWTANGYRLPTEAEWEKAARGGVSGKRFPWGEDTISHTNANFYNNGSESYKTGTTGYHPTFSTGSWPYTSPVGSFVANGYGLHDMAGNVWEWCWDWYGESTYVNNASDPRGAASGTDRVLRGGGFDYSAVGCRAAERGSRPPSAKGSFCGFRLARSIATTGGNSFAVSSQDSVVDVRNFILSITPLTNGAVTGDGSYLSGLSSNLTATPQPGYLFGVWTGDASGSANPTTVLMDSDKTVSATFVEDTRDPDSDGLTNFQEIIVRLTNPNVADSDSDGVNDGQEVIDTTNPLIADTDGDGLSDGEEKARNTNPLAKDTDGDGLSDWEEEIRSKTNPLLADTDGDSISDALEDTDNDGISNLREVTELKTDPLLVDTDADGLSDTYELIYKGSVAAFAPRIGDRLRFELRELVPQGTLKLVGALPTGLFFNAVTGVLEGKLTGKPGVVKLSIQLLNGKTVLRTIPLQFTVLAFPSGLIGTWQVLLEDANGSPQGMITTLISSPGVWSAQYDSLGTKTLRSSKGVFDLTPSMDRAAIAITFPVVSLTPAFSSSWQIDATTALAAGSYAQGTLRGFRLAKAGELPTASRQITMVIDQGEQDGYQIPAGLGWATGTLTNKGTLALSGQLGDAQSLKTTVSLSATGQAMMWVKPYRNLNSLIGGIISLRDTGIVPQSPYTSIRNGLSWRRVADTAELSYSSGFGPLAADASVNLHNKPTSSLIFSANLGLSNSEFRNVVFDGGGLPSAEQFTAMPERFVMDSTYKLNPVALPGRVMALWQGVINSTAGSFTGTIALDASNSGILKGNASASGVVFRRNDLETVGAGLIKIPTTGLKGSFRTGAFLMER
jgi:formylglycine-generating enzyme required for sulfatase activity